MDFTPEIVEFVHLDEGRFELLEWRWPDMIDHQSKESDLLLEMSLPPQAADASAEFPEIDRGHYCFMGTLFVRYPGVAIHGRGEGGHIRILRCSFSDAQARSILGQAEMPPLTVLQGLLDIRSESLRQLMGLVLRELTVAHDRSLEAFKALHALLAIELRRFLDQQRPALFHGRLAGWQYRRIRERLSTDGARATVAELADLCGISVRHLNRLFPALTGSTIGDYVKNFWIDRAKTLLAEGDMPIKAIAVEIGFAHPNSFARAFKQATGMTPQIFRQRMHRHELPRDTYASFGSRHRNST